MSLFLTKQYSVKIINIYTLFIQFFLFGDKKINFVTINLDMLYDVDMSIFYSMGTLSMTYE